MIEDYKRYLKQNSNDVFFAFTCAAGMVIFLLVIIGGVTTMMTLNKIVSNNAQLNVYRENLATFQKCAEKIEDTSLIRSYCGDAPTEPILIW